MCPSSRSGIGKTKGVVTCLNGCVLGWCVTLSFLVEGGGMCLTLWMTFICLLSTIDIWEHVFHWSLRVCVCLGITWIFTPTYPRINTQSFDILVILNTHTHAFGSFLCQKQDVVGEVDEDDVGETIWNIRHIMNIDVIFVWRVWLIASQSTGLIKWPNSSNSYCK